AECFDYRVADRLPGLVDHDAGDDVDVAALRDQGAGPERCKDAHEQRYARSSKGRTELHLGILGSAFWRAHGGPYTIRTFLRPVRRKGWVREPVLIFPG